MEKFKKFAGNVHNLWLSLVVLVAVVTLFLVVAPILRDTLFNPINRIYDEYSIIERIETDYSLETITITVGSTSWFDVTDNTKVYPLTQLYNSPLFEIDNTVYVPTMIDGVVHIPDSYPR